MAKQKTGEQPEVSAEKAESTEEKVVPQEGTQEESSEPVPDLKKITEEMKASQEMIGRQAKELGDLRNETAWYRSQFQNLQGLFRPQEAKVNPYEQLNEQFYEKPAENVAKIAEEIVSKKLKEQEEQTARTNFDIGMRMAVKENPELFKGVEQDVGQIMEVMYRKGLMPASELLKTENWMLAVGAVKMKRGEYPHPTQIRPAQPVGTQTPNPVRTETETGERPTFSASDRMMINAYNRALNKNLTEKEAADMLAKGRK